MTVRKDSKIRIKSMLDSNGKFIKSYREDGKQLLTLEGIYHHNMITRSTNPNYKNSFPTYDGVSVSENFRDFQYFAKWCQTQIGFGNVGWVLDKDLIFKGNKIYSEDTCCFLPPIINSFIVERKLDRILPRGVSWCESEDCYKVYCSQLNGKNKTIGRFKDSNIAGKAYIDYKLKLKDELIKEFKDLVDNRAIKSLDNYFRGD